MKLAGLSFNQLCAVGIYACLLCAFSLLGIIRALTAKAERSLFLLYLPLFLCSFFFMYCIDHVGALISGGRELLAFSKFVLDFPVFGVLSALAALSVCVVLLWLRLQKRLRAMLTPASVREGLDRMPDGVLYSTVSGIPLLVNEQMQRISHAAFGVGVLDTLALRRRLEADELAEGCRVRRVGESVFLHLADGTVWDLRLATLHFGRGPVWECIAYDVTELYAKSRELEKRNELLASVNAQIREYSRNLDSITRDRETLAAKIRIHDDVGRSLLALRSYLARPDGDRERLVHLWRKTISLLRREAVSQSEDDRIGALIQAARAVDVKLIFDGALPADPALEEIIAVAIHECLTNTIKHAGGSVLNIQLRECGETVTVELTNDGRQPAGPVSEKGGLRTLRRAVELHGGTMEIEWTPRFLLRVVLAYRR